MIYPQTFILIFAISRNWITTSRCFTVGDTLRYYNPRSHVIFLFKKNHRFTQFPKVVSFLQTSSDRNKPPHNNTTSPHNHSDNVISHDASRQFAGSLQEPDCQRARSQRSHNSQRCQQRRSCSGSCHATISSNSQEGEKENIYFILVAAIMTAIIKRSMEVDWQQTSIHG